MLVRWQATFHELGTTKKDSSRSKPNLWNRLDPTHIRGITVRGISRHNKRDYLKEEKGGISGIFVGPS